MFQKIYTGTVNGHLFLGGAVAEEEPEEPVGHGRVVPVGRAAQSLQGAVGRVGHTGTTKTTGKPANTRILIFDTERAGRLKKGRSNFRGPGATKLL